MDSKTNKLVSRCAWTVIISFVIRILIGYIKIIDFLKCETWYDYFGAAGEAIGFSTIVLVLYDKFLWKYNPLDKTPKLYGKYSGKIKYKYNNQTKSKSTDVYISQTSMKVKVKITTNEITSDTITSALIEENDASILYYSYITTPRSIHNSQNPSQYGTCRLVQIDEKTLEGIYWTSRKTVGDIKLTKNS